MLPEHFYFTGAGWLGYVFYVPLALGLVGLLYAFVVRKIPIKIIRWPVLVILVIVSLTAPLWQALSISYQAEKLCKEQGGLHVYKTAETDSLLGPASTKRWIDYGFSYIERSGPNNRRYRFTMKNGNEISEEITEYTSRYISRGGGFERVNKYFARTRYIVEDQHNHDILGDLVIIIIYPSNFDLFFLSLLSIEFNPWHCGDKVANNKNSNYQGNSKHKYNYADLIKATLKPITKNKGAGKDDN